MEEIRIEKVSRPKIIERIEEETKKNDNQEEIPEMIAETSEPENDEKIENSETSETESDEKIENSETEIEEEDENEIRKDLQNDKIGAKYLQVEKSIYFMDYQIYSVEVPVKDHGKPEIV